MGQTLQYWLCDLTMSYNNHEENIIGSAAVWGLSNVSMVAIKGSNDAPSKARIAMFDRW